MIVIPMAGLSSRFTAAGYTVPKYMLEAHGKSLFAHSVGSFAAYFANTPFLFIARDLPGAREFIASEIAAMGIKRSATVILDKPTAGQAETVSQGLKLAEVPVNQAITIFNIDTFRPNFSFPTFFDAQNVDGYLEVFHGSGMNWSYVRPADEKSDRVIETAEKRPISNLCCTGLYNFSSAGLFNEAYQDFLGELGAPHVTAEHYIAPLYNSLVKRGKDIRFYVIRSDEVIFCGVPDEYSAFLAATTPFLD